MHGQQNINNCMCFGIANSCHFRVRLLSRSDQQYSESSTNQVEGLLVL